ncbi:tripartite tricarboxylate transporter substrate binding protein [Bradyrhizobium sp. 6(2017)]|uniref:tripartite tricarboxylate transporter substrate binding protein n=1 Tax=Bradyrhizobium sp. 6(2017) TaxID=1197460 RepID=UPI0013E16D95|nr:tripartite tricarboxylate transporter substrate binding protein [Bradyrhizobium sp. 6(2017)]QIG97677.1 tripartite tricarboxylate transporter substrate binding protein [Bradyrhizobium sp. 6(2017)]
MQASDYPQRPVRVIVPSSAGGTTDLIARIVSSRLAKLLGQSFVVENRVGANGVVGEDYVSRQKPDGYTIMFVPSGHAINNSIYKNIAYDPEKDFTPIILINTVPLAVVARPGLQVEHLADLVSLARAKPERITFGSGGIGSSNQLATELFATQFNLKLVHVPFNGDSPTINGLLGDQIDFAFINVPAVLPYIKEKTLKVLAVSTAGSIPSLPDVPPVAATAPGYIAASWHAVFAPAKLPPEIVATLNRGINQVLSLPEVRSRLAEMGIEVKGGTSDELAGFLHSEIAKWAEIARIAKVKAE